MDIPIVARAAVSKAALALRRYLDPDDNFEFDIEVRLALPGRQTAGRA